MKKFIGLIVLLAIIGIGLFVADKGRRLTGSGKEKTLAGFLRPFRRSSDIEKQLQAKYIPMFQTMGIPPAHAKDICFDMLKDVKEEAEKEGTLSLPKGLGNILLAKESTNEKVKSMLAKRRKEGVKDEDIKWWWNMHDLERRMILKAEDIKAVVLFLKLQKESGFNEYELSKKMRKYCPIFGAPVKTISSLGEDRPLPYELKDRIDAYVKKREQAAPEKFKKEIEESSTFNALIRKEIKAGNL